VDDERTSNRTILHVTKMREISVEEWRSVDARRPAPTFHARPAWAEALAASNPSYVPAPLACDVSDGSRCIVPMVRARAPLGMKAYIGTPFGGYTVVLTENGELAPSATAVSVLRHVMRCAGQSVAITPWPMAVYAQDLFDGLGVEQAASVVDLADGADAAIARMDGKFRRMAGQADRRGVTCAADRSPGAAAAYYAILEESAMRWGRKTPTYPRSLLDALVARGGADVEIWFAMFEGAPIAGGVMLYGADEVSFWSAAMRSDFGALRPSNALNVALIRAAADRKVRWYNLGSSEGLPGVQRFKEGVGAVTLAYHTWRRDSALYGLYRRLRGRRTRWV
jgi:hypothetical protein